MSVEQMVIEALANIEKNCPHVQKYGHGEFVIEETYDQGRYDTYLTVLEAIRCAESN
jgi:hypothetical protein